MATFYRADVLGSLLRPAHLKQARQAWQAGQAALLVFLRHLG